MLTQIKINRINGAVTFDTVSIDNSSNVFFTNLDPEAAHWPTLASNQVGPYQSPNSSQCPVPAPQVPNPDHKEGDNKPPLVGKTPPYQVTYKCNIPGHEAEQGTINVFAVLAAATTALANATKDQPIKEQQVVQGGMSPYAISCQLFQVTDSNNNVIQSGSGIGPELQLNAKTDNTGITVSGTPTLSGTYAFTFVVDDNMGGNLQQIQYSMKVA
jgi:hypothetical protein